jgi:ATP-dependent DNA ligase
VDPETAALVDSYKKTVCKNYISLNPGQIDDRLGGMSFYVTRKYDGEFSMLLWNGTDLFTVNTGGKVRTGLPCMEEAAKLLKAAGIREAAIPSELHVDEARGRRRVFDVLAALADPSLHDSLRLAPFDIVSLNGEPFRAASYGAAHEKLEALFPGGGYCGPVRCQGADSKALVKDLFVKWVEEEGAEGLVVRSELPLIYKIKPRYSIDAAVVGFSESAENRGQIRSLLLALMPEEGIFQIIGRSGTGLGEELKRELFERLMGMKIPSKYTETDSNHVAFHMIRPEIVIELTVNDVLFETGSGAIFNPKLEIKNNEYRRVGAVPGISVVFPIFERIREDKTVSLRDVRLAQADEIVFNPYAEPAAAARELPESTVLCRDVYKKTQGTKLMVQKFLAWKTNKEHAGYPAYVVSYTNFSSERADPLQCEVRVSGSREQILELYQNFMEKNIKKGWAKVE